MRIFIFSLILFCFSCNNTSTKETTTKISKSTTMEFTPNIDNIDWQGHRGARGILPENTIPAFLKALEFPVTTLELDVAISKDGKVIVSHEPWFNHAISSHPDGTPVTEEEEDKLLIYEMTYEEIKKYDVGSRGNARFPNQQPMKVHKPSLEDMVNAVDEHCKKTGRALPNFDIEVKSQPSYYGKKSPQPAEYVKIVLEAIKKTGIEKRSNLQSFDLNVLEEIHQQSPETIVAYLIENVDSMNANLEKLSFKPDIYSPYFLALSKEMIEELHEKDIKVIPWTVNDRFHMQFLIQIGVDGIITDYPNYIEDVIKTFKS